MATVSKKSPKSKAAKWQAETLEVFPYQGDGLACLVVQTNGDTRSSELNACANFSTDDPETLFAFKGWIYSMWLTPDDEVYLAHSGKVIRRGTLAAPEVVLTHDQDVTRLCGAKQGVYVLGLDGYVGHFDGKTLAAMPIENCDNVSYVTEANDGTLFAAASNGRIFRRSDNKWQAIQVAVGCQIYHLAAVGHSDILFAGDNGVCGQLTGETVTLFKAEASRNFFAIAVYRNDIYVGAGRFGLDVVKDGAVVACKPNVFSFKLFADDKYLFTSGLNQAARFDGSAWLATEFTPGS